MESFVLMIRGIYLAVGLCAALAGCHSEPKFTRSPIVMNCNQGSCLVSFDLTNTSEDSLPLIYDISLYRMYGLDPEKMGRVEVGAANGSIEVSPTERETVEVEIEVTETPTGWAVSLSDSRTRKVNMEVVIVTDDEVVFVTDN